MSLFRGRERARARRRNRVSAFADSPTKPASDPAPGDDTPPPNPLVPAPTSPGVVRLAGGPFARRSLEGGVKAAAVEAPAATSLAPTTPEQAVLVPAPTLALPPVATGRGAAATVPSAPRPTPNLPPHVVSMRVLIAGPPGVGKSALAVALLAGGDAQTAPTVRGDTDAAERSATFRAPGGALTATLVEAPPADTWGEAAPALVAAAEAARAAALDAELSTARAAGVAGDAAPLVDIALLLIPPHAPASPALAALAAALARAGATVLPVLACADAYSPDELATARRSVGQALASSLPPLPFTAATLDAAGAPRCAPPFAVAAPGPGRGATLSDLAALRELLLGAGVADVKRATRDGYEAWRKRALENRGASFSPARRPPVGAVLAAIPWRTVIKFAGAAAAGYAAVALATGGRARLAADARALKAGVLGRAREVERRAAVAAEAVATAASGAAAKVERGAATAKDTAGKAASAAASTAEEDMPGHIGFLGLRRGRRRAA